MAPSTYKLGPGLLTIGTDTDLIDVSVQLRSCTITPSENVSEEDDIEVLSGDTVYGEDDVTHDFTVDIVALQDTLEAGGMIDYSWINRGQVRTFTFVPRLGMTRAVVGQLRIVPLSIGGDVKARPETSVSFPGTGSFPTLTEAPTP